VTIVSLFLSSPTLPAGKTISFNLANAAEIEALKKNPVTIKEGTDYSSVALNPVSPALLTG